MARGTTHRLITAAVASPIAVGVYAATGSPEVATAAGIGCMLGMIVHPDVDQQEHAGLLWQPYARILSHRSPFSHFPIIGTIGRVVYLAGLSILLFALGVVAVHLAVYAQENWQDVRWLVAFGLGGLALADVLHWVADGMPV